MPIPASQVFDGSSPPASDSGPISAKDFFAKKEAKPARKSGSLLDSKAIARGAAAPVTDYWSHFKELSNGYLAKAKKDFRDTDKQETILGQLSSAAKGWLDLAGAVWSPAEAGVDTWAAHPIQHAVRLAGEQVEKAAADDSTYEPTPQERREAALSGKPLPSKGGAKITKNDVRQTVESLNQFIEMGLQTGAGMVGGEESLISRAGKEASGARKTEEALNAARAAGDIPKETPKVLGPEIEKPRLRPVGVDAATGKPRVRVVSPEEASAKVAQSVQDIHQDHALETPKTQVPSQAFQEWGDLHYKMQGTYQRALISGEEVSAHDLLDEMIAKTPKQVAPVKGSLQTAQASYLRPYLEKLRQYVDNVPVKIAEQLEDSEGQLHDKFGGLYRPGTHDVQVRADLPNPFMTHAAVHELTHAATVRFMQKFPNHPLVKEVDQLMKEVNAHLDAQEAASGPKTASWTEAGGGRETPYGMKNAREFVAEAMTNTKFQRTLAKVKSGGVSAFNKLATILARMFGMKLGEATVLHRAMQTTEDLMKAQKEHFSSKGKVIVPGSDAPISLKEFGESVKISKPGRAASATASRLAGYIDELLRAVAPETRSDAAKTAGAIVASRISERVHATAAWATGSRARLNFWQSHSKEGGPFVSFFERGAKFKDPTYEKIAQAYRDWSSRVVAQDVKNGIKYEPRDNYLTHVFEDQAGVADFFAQKFGKRWGDPSFTKDREFNLYEEAIKAGYTPRFTNPEEIMLARQYSSDIAHMQVGILDDLTKAGLASKREKGAKIDLTKYTMRRGPNGEKYRVNNDAFQILHNAFDSTSLWSVKGMAGDAYRAAMFLKNSIVPIRLAISGFHALHVIGIDNAASIQMALKGVLSGTTSAPKALGQIIRSGLLYESLAKNPRLGNRLVNVWDGKIPAHELTEADTQALQNMIEGGFVPKMSQVYRTNADKSFMAALRGHQPLKAAWHAPWALLSTLNKPLMEHWIPNLKAASYTRQTALALKADPRLLDNPLARQLAFRKIAKSVDNRYGEMSYDTLFWKRYIKDLAVANTLSLGWQMGFIREYGGGALDIGQFVKGSDKLARVRRGNLDRPLFVAAYTTTALAYGGLMTYALSGESPQSLMDYIFPVVGKNPDGTPQRVNTMYYTREFGSVYKHMENEGVVSGLTDLVASKGSGVVGLVGEWARGVNQYGQEIADPDAPFFKNLEQKLAYTLTDLEPISTKAIREQVEDEPVKGTLLNLAGFTPAAKFLTDTKTEAHIKIAYGKYVAPKQTPFDRAQYSDDFRQLKKAYDAEDEAFGDKLEAMTDKFGLNSDDRGRIMRRLRSDVPSTIRQFEQIGRESWQEQKKLLDAMTPEERDIYLPHSDKKHLRNRYEAPEDQE